MTKINAPVVLGDAAWVACSSREFGPVGDQRHLARTRMQGKKQVGFSLTTLCGASASVEGIWRRNTSKPKCRTCEDHS
jgi:hypothetical protein